jgi:hypothetical protein
VHIYSAVQSLFLLSFSSKKGELNSILDILASKYQETPLSTLECFYFPGDAEDVENYGQALMDWTSDIRKQLIQLKSETAKMLREKEKEKESELSKDWLLSEFSTYEQRLRNLYRSIVKFEYWLKIKYKPAPLPSTQQDSSPNDDVPLTERLDKVSLKHQSLSSITYFPEIYYLRSATPSLQSKPPVPNFLRVFSKSTKNTS